MSADGLDAVVRAAGALARARDDLARAVEDARGGGATWADVGEVLGISRQAAFKRFGRPRDPTDAGTMTPRSTGHVTALTEQVVREIDAGDYDALRARMPDEVAAELTRDTVLGVWRSVVAEIGNLEGFEDTHVELVDRTRLEPGEAVLGTVVGDTVVRCEAGEVRARVAVDERDRVLGLLLVPPDATDLPF